MKIAPWDYYSVPWEYEPDLLGGVVAMNSSARNYAEWAPKVYEIYHDIGH